MRTSERTNEQKKWIRRGRSISSSNSSKKKWIKKTNRTKSNLNIVQKKKRRRAPLGAHIGAINACVCVHVRCMRLSEILTLLRTISQSDIWKKNKRWIVVSPANHFANVFVTGSLDSCWCYYFYQILIYQNCL